MPFRPAVASVALLSKALCSTWWARSVTVRGLDGFLARLYDERRRAEGRGLLTYANHISVMDDPGLFGCLPFRTFLRPETTRWTLGAADVMFTNPVFAHFFRAGQVLPTDRGRGVFQPALDAALDRLAAGDWVHLFPEGYVNMSRRALCRRFKWGIGRLLLEAEPHARPVVCPIWIEGFDSVMPEPRGPPRWFPRPGADLQITFGEPVEDALEPLLRPGALLELADTHPAPPAASFPPPTPLAAPPSGGYALPLAGSRSQRSLALGGDSPEMRERRSAVARKLREELLLLGERAGGPGVRQLAHRAMKEESA